MTRTTVGALLTILIICAAVSVPHISFAREKSAGAAPSLIAPGSAEEVPDWMARWELARILGYAKRYDESIAEYKKLLKEKPNLTKARFEMAQFLFWSKHVPESLEVLEAVPAAQQTDESLLLMADLYRIQKSYTKAEPLYRDHLRKHPDDQATRLKFAEMLSWEKHYDESLAEYRRILSALPNDIQVRRKYGLVLMWANRSDEAAKELRRTLK
jgi:tetratricopeptide (TPR) repeat protein